MRATLDIDGNRVHGQGAKPGCPGAAERVCWSRSPGVVGPAGLDRECYRSPGVVGAQVADLPGAG